MISQDIVSAALISSNGTRLAELPIIAGSLTLDERNVPFVEADLTIPLPDFDTLRLLDPRTLQRVRIEITKRFDGGEPLSIAVLTSRYRGRGLAGMSQDYAPSKQIAVLSESLINRWNGPNPPEDQTLYTDLYLMEAEADYQRDEMTLVLAGEEALLMQDASSGQTPYAPGNEFLGTIVSYVLQNTVGRVLLSEDLPYPKVDPEASVWEAGVTAWDYLKPMVEAAGKQLWCDHLGYWHLKSQNVGPRTHSFERENVTSMSDVRSRLNTWGDAVIVKYSWDDANGDAQTRIDYAKSVPDPTKPRVFERESPYPGPGAASTLLRFVRTRGQDVRLTAVSDYTVYPGDSVNLRLPDGTRLTKVVASVSYSFDSDEMTVVTRDAIAEGETL
ncbi:hypothetical protein ASF48_06970 [Rathayibacter sp. Leaf299]|uniref:hypothetical protein n=1 Tax=Rathayibacter sp. Leaf299 TaxID=1736328 RepID=UPI0006F91158|nr:hypothetical protein [Rathayibacter sp. Leaf299]KQQ22872.1 hypothetical protein ASF48_06970 [Rathayibacter sp. Leaf299]